MHPNATRQPIHKISRKPSPTTSPNQQNIDLHKLCHHHETSKIKKTRFIFDNRFGIFVKQPDDEENKKVKKKKRTG